MPAEFPHLGWNLAKTDRVPAKAPIDFIDHR